LEQQERAIYQRKQQLKDALATGKDLPTEMRKSAMEMRKDLPFDAAQEEPTSSVDYEYSRAGIRDPKIVITTSRDPSSKLLQFSKVLFLPLPSSTLALACALTDPLQEMRLVIPNSHRINRGNYVVKELAEACRANEVTDLVILHETRGVPGEDDSI
jgi:U3 small nucleolar ribonucleoprotein protein IMP4